MLTTGYVIIGYVFNIPFKPIKLQSICGITEYFKNGVYHNEHGPAYVNLLTGQKEYFLNGKSYHYLRWREIVQGNNKNAIQK